jgi:Thioredoxin
VTLNTMPGDRELALAPLDENVDHVRGLPAGRLIIEYGDYECPYSRQAFHAIERAGQQLGGNVRFAFRHFPLTGIHRHALAAAAAAEAAARQGRFWDMHELLWLRTGRCRADVVRRRKKCEACLMPPPSTAPRTGGAGWSWA